MKVEIRETKSGHYTAIVDYFEESMNREVSISLCSQFDPINEAKIWAKKNYDRERKSFLIYGLGLGYHIEALLELIEAHQMIYVIDANEAFCNQVKNYIPREKWNKDSIKVLVSSNLNKINDFLSHISDYSTKVLIHIPSMKIIPGKCYSFKHVLEGYSISGMQQITNGLIEDNRRVNSQIKCRSVEDLYEKWKEKPLIIVSGGPSLDGNIHDLRMADEDVCIFSTSRTLRKLIGEQIRVDMFGMLDPKPSMIEHIKGMETLDIPFIFSNSAYKEAPIRYMGPKYRAYSMDEAENLPGRVEAGGSVATAMLDMAIKFGANPIIFVGQDLAFTNGLSHCENPMGVKVKEREYLKQVRDVEGNYISTTKALLSYKYWIEQKIRKHNQIRFINATEGGAYIEGCEHIGLRDILQEINEVYK